MFRSISSLLFEKHIPSPPLVGAIAKIFTLASVHNGPFSGFWNLMFRIYSRLPGREYYPGLGITSSNHQSPFPVHSMPWDLSGHGLSRIIYFPLKAYEINTGTTIPYILMILLLSCFIMFSGILMFFLVLKSFKLVSFLVWVNWAVSL